MQRFHAARSYPRLAAAASGLLAAMVLALGLAALGLVAGAVSPADAARAPRRSGPARSVRDAAPCQGAATLRITTRHPVQLRAVGFNAAGSHVTDGSIVFYDFSYGDGTDDATTVPTSVHAYPQTGTYLARLNVVTSCNSVISSVAYHIVVRDGLPPVVAITYPKPNETVHFGRLGLQLRGTAEDPSGVARVEIAIQIVGVGRAAQPKLAGCYWYDGHVSLRLRGCNAPLFFPVSLVGRHWTFRMNARSQIPPGVYVVRIRASDRLGNRTSVYSPKLSDIQGFKLIP